MSQNRIILSEHTWIKKCLQMCQYVKMLKNYSMWYPNANMNRWLRFRFGQWLLKSTTIAGRWRQQELGTVSKRYTPINVTWKHRNNAHTRCFTLPSLVTRIGFMFGGNVSTEIIFVIFVQLLWCGVLRKNAVDRVSLSFLNFLSLFVLVWLCEES